MKLKQHEAVVQALSESGGFATLGEIYKKALSYPDCSWGTKTPYASIRRILQTRPELFFKIRPGLWGLKSQEKQILKRLRLGTPATEERQQQFSHSYYQGLLVEIGNLKGYRTFVPNQDKNKLYLEKKLCTLTSLTTLPQFTYPHLVKKASTIDVVWMNHRDFPEAFFEVEHSTDFRNALGRFSEFLDFRTKFRIVADESRKKHYDAILNESAFAEVRSFVKFVSYTQVAEYHSRLVALAQVQVDL